MRRRSITSATVRHLVSADFNEDGILDLALAAGNNVSVWFGRGSGGAGNGTFILNAAYSPGAAPNGIAVGDFNEDGILDLVAVGGSSTAAVLLGQGTGGFGNGTFGAATGYSAGSSPQQVTLGDFSEDGITDL